MIPEVARRHSGASLHTQHIEAHRPFYSPAWGRWIVPLGGRNFRTATAQEVKDYQAEPQPDRLPVGAHKPNQEGQQWPSRNA